MKRRRDQDAEMEVVSVQTRNECALHGAEGREPWGRAFRGIEVVRCDHLGSTYVVEMVLLAGSEEQPQYSRHIHFVRDGQREVHALAESLSQHAIDEVWLSLVAAMERGDRPRSRVAEFHSSD
jgi:hypothetical protein